jgi:5-(hydroxymethyl)furfural/furfural oxidase
MTSFDCVDEKLFDIIIVGSSAGGVLAARLSENPSLRILLLEAGNDHRSATMSKEMKAVNPMALWADPTWTWRETEVSRTDAQLPRFYPVGCGLGGGSAMNGMGAIRPSKEDFDEWESKGCDGWGWNQMLPCLRRLEKDPLGDAQPDIHGVEGPVPIYRLPRDEWGPVATAMRSCALELGYGEAPDINHPAATGCVSFAYNVEPDCGSTSQMRRVSVNDGYIEKARVRPNVTVKCNTVVDRVIFDSKKRATGVVLASGLFIACRHEVIVCGGAMHSPAILQRSGIGPSQLLDALAIPIVADVPGVGAGLQDHPVINGRVPLHHAAPPEARHTTALVRFSSSAAAPGQAAVEPDTFNDLYFVAVEHGTDPRAQTAAALAPLPSVALAPAPHRPELDARDEGQHSAELDADPIGAADAPIGFIDVMLLKVYSRGAVRIRSRDPLQLPCVQENMLSDERDVKRMAVGVSRLASMLATRTIADLAAPTGRPITIGQKGLGGLSVQDAAALAARAGPDFGTWARQHASDGIHMSSSCSMGPPEAKWAVVDSDCRVRGVSNLRVVDASIMPSCVRANTHLATIAIAERAAEIISAAYQAGTDASVRISLLGSCEKHVFEIISSWIHEEWPEETRAFGQSNADAVLDRLLASTFRPSATAAQGEAALPVTLVASVGGAVVGSVSLCAEDMAGRDAEFGPWLAALYVKPEARGTGVASALLTAADRLAKRLNLPRLSLWFPKSKPRLLELYRRHGWVVVEESHYQSSSFGGDVVIMSLPRL